MVGISPDRDGNSLRAYLLSHIRLRLPTSVDLIPKFLWCQFGPWTFNLNRDDILSPLHHPTPSPSPADPPSFLSIDTPTIFFPSLPICLCPIPNTLDREYPMAISTTTTHLPTPHTASINLCTKQPETNPNSTPTQSDHPSAYSSHIRNISILARQTNQSWRSATLISHRCKKNDTDL